MEKVIDEGDKSKQGNMVCPSCGKRVLITQHWGDPPKCPDCDTMYRPDYPHPTPFI